MEEQWEDDKQSGDTGSPTGRRIRTLAGYGVLGILLAVTAAAPAIASEPATTGGAAVIRRLSPDQYRQIVADIFGNTIKIGGRFEPDARTDGLLAVGSSQVSITSTGLEQYDAIARSAADQVVDEQHRGTLISCKPASAGGADDACASQFLGEVGRLLYRRPLTQPELQAWVQGRRQMAGVAGGVPTRSGAANYTAGRAGVAAGGARYGARYHIIGTPDMSRLDDCLAFTLREEGGFVDDPRDPGGATNMGITLATLRVWRDDKQLDVAAIEDLTVADATTIYGADFWNRARCDALPAGVDLLVFDHGVNAGTIRSAKLLQQTLGFAPADVDGSIGPDTLASAGAPDGAALARGLSGADARTLQAALDVAQDGVVGPVTLGLAQAAPLVVLAVALHAAQTAYYRALPTFRTFGKGWLTRADRRLALALSAIPRPVADLLG